MVNRWDGAAARAAGDRGGRAAGWRVVIVCERHGAQHDCINDRAGVACELGDADLEPAPVPVLLPGERTFPIFTTIDLESDDDAPADAEPVTGIVINMDGTHTPYVLTPPDPRAHAGLFLPCPLCGGPCRIDDLCASDCAHPDHQPTP